MDPTTIPTPAKPLTPSFPVPGPRPTVPPGQQLATPRFLLSLLAASIYLSIPSITRQCVTLILSSVGPYTVVPYLSFAVGDGIGPLTEGDTDSAVGLERVAESVKVDPERYLSLRRAHARQQKGEDGQSLSLASEAASMRGGENTGDQLSTFDLESKKEDPSIYEDSSGSSIRGFEILNHNQLYLHYGTVSDKIGEAAACWLARWGVDMLHYEIQAKDATKSGPGSTGENFGTARRSTVSTTRPAGGFLTFHPMPSNVPVIWRRGGIAPRWIRALLSSDSMFVRDEKERYDAAKMVVELRRSEGIDVEEEIEFAKLFTEGIYYQNMVSFLLFCLAMWSADGLLCIVAGRPRLYIRGCITNHWPKLYSTRGHSICSLGPSTLAPQDHRSFLLFGFPAIVS